MRARKLRLKNRSESGDFSFLCTVGEGVEGSSGVEGSESGDTAPGLLPQDNLDYDLLNSKIASLSIDWESRFENLKVS